jgi:hypothetical protein
VTLPGPCHAGHRYGTPQPYAGYFAKTRPGGLDAFGITEWGGCGYTNSYDGVGEVVFPREAIAAYGDANEDSAGEPLTQGRAGGGSMQRH